MPEATAPGKLVVSGEYAVLAAAPAIAVAMDVRASARIDPGNGGCRLDVAGQGTWPFDWDGGGRVRWQEQPTAGRGRVLEAAAAALADAGSPLRQPLAITLDSRVFQDSGGGKLGLGSSAAITVALLAALQAAAGEPVPGRAELLALAGAAHRDLQDGAGSGIDVAAAVHGGVVALTPGDGVESLGWPPGLHWFAAWSGHGAATPPLLARFAAWRRRGNASGEALLARLCAAAVTVLEAWRSGTVAAILAALADYRMALVAVDAAAGIGIITPAHQRLAALAADAGCFYKTSGAGGGDFGLVLAADAAAIERARHAFAAAGILMLAGQASEPGVTVR